MSHFFQSSLCNCKRCLHSNDGHQTKPVHHYQVRWKYVFAVCREFESVYILLYVCGTLYYWSVCFVVGKVVLEKQKQPNLFWGTSLQFTIRETLHNRFVGLIHTSIQNGHICTPALISPCQICSMSLLVLEQHFYKSLSFNQINGLVCLQII